MYGLGLIKDVPDARDFPMGGILKAIQLPVSVDYEKNMTPVRDQGQRGACVGFASVAVKEYQERKEQSSPTVGLDLSEEWVYDQVKQPGGGASPRDAFKVLDKNGVCEEKVMPYKNITDAQDHGQFKPSKVAIKSASQYKSKNYAKINTLGDLKASLVANGPLLLGVDWLEGWFTPAHIAADGYPIADVNEGAVAGGHALCAVGYDDNLKVVKIKNSWGTSWGKSGYFYMTYAAVEANLSDSWASFDIANAAVHKSVVEELISNKNK